MGLKSNPGVQSDVAKTPASSASIGLASGTVVPANAARVEVTICNDHATQIAYLSLGGTAAVNTGIRLNAAGGSYTTKAYTGIITAIATGAATVLTFSEV